MAVGVLVLAVVGCSGGNDEFSAARGENGYRPSRFQFVSGAPGRAEGLQAVAELPSGDVESDRVDIDLLEPPANIEEDDQEALPEDAVLGATSQLLCSTRVGETPDALEPMAGKICWVSFMVGGGAFGASVEVGPTLLLTREGSYVVLSRSNLVHVPADLASFGSTVSVGCLTTEDESVTVDYLDSLAAVSVSLAGPEVPIGTVGRIDADLGLSGGISFFHDDEGRARAFQYDLSLPSIGAGLFYSPASFSYEWDSEFLVGPVLRSRNEGLCGDARSPFDPDAIAAMGESSDSLRSAALETLKPLLRHLAGEEGFGPALHMMAGSNADAWASLGGQGLQGEQDFSASPPSTLDDLANAMADTFVAAEDDRERAAALARRALDVQNVLPSPGQLEALLRDAAAGLDLLAAATLREFGGLDYFGDGVVRVEGRAGEEVSLVFTSRELADLLDVEEAQILGSTLTLQPSHTLAPSDYVLSQSSLELSFAPESSTSILVRVDVDLSTADGPLPDELLDAVVELTPRLVVVEAGPPVGVRFSTTSRVVSGGAVTLNAAVVDRFGNPVGNGTQVAFYDGEGDLVGSTSTRDGFAALQYVPTPSEVAAVE